MEVRGVLAWSTNRTIRISYFKESFDVTKKGHEQKICKIDLAQQKQDKYPDYLNNPRTSVTPSIIFKKSYQTIHDVDPNNLTLITTWFNMVKVTELVFNKETRTYSASAQAKKTIFCPDTFIGSSCFFDKDKDDKLKFLTLQFKYDGSKDIKPRFGLTKTQHLFDYMKSPENFLADTSVSRPLNIPGD